MKQKGRKQDFEQVEKLKCELTLGGPGDESKDTIKAGKQWKQAFQKD